MLPFRSSSRLYGFLTIVLAFFAVCGVCRAHKLVLFASTEGAEISGWAYFAGGGKLKGETIAVLGPGEKKLGEVTTNGEGAFTFTAEHRCDHTFVAETGAGHRTEYTVKASDLPANLPPLSSHSGDADAEEARSEAESQQTRVAAPDVAPKGTGSLSESELQEAVASAVARQIRPLRRELQAYREQVRFRDIVGGIGYILGITGILFYLKSRGDSGSEVSE